MLARIFFSVMHSEWGAWFERKNWLLSGVTGSIFGLIAEIAGVITDNTNKLLLIGFCGFAGAFVGSIPRILAIWFNHKASDREFASKEMRDLIAYLKKNAEDNDRILDLATAVRHSIQESYQTAVWHISFLESRLHKEGITDIPSAQTLDVAALLRKMDEETKLIKSPNKETQ